MSTKKISVGFCMCGSFCTLDTAITALENLVDEGYDIYPIMSQITYTTSTRFGEASEFIARIEKASGREVLHTIPEVEPIGPKNYLDILIVAPCTGNTLGKLVGGIYDSSVTLAVKAQLRNKKPVVLAVATNDGLANSAQNIGKMLAMPNVYPVPLGQDDPISKPDSLVADFSRISETIEKALKHERVQPVFFCN